ncbi:major capsid protein [Dipodfec virus RodF1_53]|uniref:Major capsid protein n=1 Tax=Dipodfec virus RodF1_53 TaxID=2929302 RepID=A0A976R5K5_9VIRU|nr:major capsid protein [Dipodfec virus RodF1_53]
MKSIMVNQFKQLPDVHFSRNTFNTTFSHLTTLDAGLLYPVGRLEVSPGETIKCTPSLFGRINTMIVPSYVNIYADIHFWYVPNRLVFDDWGTFMGETFNPYGGEKTDPDSVLMPICEAPTGGFPRYGVADYMGVPPAIDKLWMDANYLRAYNLIWNCFYRSETLQEPVLVKRDAGPDDYSLYNLLPRGKRFDYFTSCLPEPQRGESVYLPLGTTAPVMMDTTKTLPITWNTGSSLVGGNANQYGAIQKPGNSNGLIGADHHSSGPVISTNLTADLTTAAGTTIQAFRNLVALNQFLERENRYGNRLQEIIYGHYGVEAPDNRLQLPEYLGGDTIRLNVSSVPQTSASSSDVTPQGNLSAYGVLANTGGGFYRSFVEHGVILCLLSIRADLQYQQGLDRKLRRRKKLDYFFPEFAGISDQEVYNYEIYADGTQDDMEVFGYNERYAEYRFNTSYVSGKMRTSDPQSLDIWHAAQYFKNRPQLNSEFIVEDPPIDRLIAVQDEPQFTVDCLFEVESTLALPLYGIPGLERL